eukprot:3231700-Pyramimonas_sp.AAC.1
MLYSERFESGALPFRKGLGRSLCLHALVIVPYALCIVHRPFMRHSLERWRREKGFVPYISFLRSADDCTNIPAT